VVYYDLDAENHVMTITWDDVGYFGSHSDHLNAFQLQLIGLGDGDFDIVFRYEDINWTTGDASEGSGGLGGDVARAGYSAGDGDPDHYFELEQSGHQDQMLALEGTSQPPFSNPGVFVFNVQSGEVTTAPIANGEIEFSDPDVSDTHHAFVQQAGDGYLGNFSLDDVNDADHSVAWHFTLGGDDVSTFFNPDAAQVRQQSYNVTIADAQRSVTERVALNVASAASDTFVFAPGDGQQVIFNFDTQSQNADHIDLAAFGIESESDLLLQAVNNNSDTLIDLGHGDSVTVIGAHPADLQNLVTLHHNLVG
jgi:hypothetical protein